MNRSCVVGELTASAECPPGRAVVATRFRHGDRAAVHSPGAELLAGTLDRYGLTAALGVLGPPGPAAVDSAGFAVSFELGAPGYAGLAAVVAPGDRDARELTRRAVERWAAVLRTRLLVATGSAPHCRGARDLAEAVRQAGQATAGPVLVSAAGGCGTAAAEAEGAAPAARAGEVLVVGPLGAPDQTRRQALAVGATVVDVPCRRLAAAEAEIARLAGAGEQVLLAAREDTAAVRRLAGSPQVLGVVTGRQDCAQVRVPDPRRVGVALSPGQPVQPLLRLSDELRRQFGHIVPQHPSTYCFEADDRRDSVRAVAALADLLLVAAAPDDAEAARLASWAPPGVAVRVVTGVREIEPEWLAGVGAVGVTETVHASVALAGQILAALRGLGPSDTVYRSVTTRRAGTGRE
ncbi:hypothetical protein C7C46_14045 [Streptomyces tateyamensis]|uniref:4-hydroxy-3-methylbut-2-enyl diphosphate reductase n=1 Tax=Streptomyces tateyamensis TaxID=565073 RepID=A0A2V4NCQ0_9ACTN|nr:hypothetical protein [Streptomyces tateyamensis]PYC79484.1 hypothetical protein C7C46_14045 [Streptomyces tateyamensis]